MWPYISHGLLVYLRLPLFCNFTAPIITFRVWASSMTHAASPFMLRLHCLALPRNTKLHWPDWALPIFVRPTLSNSNTETFTQPNPWMAWLLPTCGKIVPLRNVSSVLWLGHNMCKSSVESGNEVLRRVWMWGRVCRSTTAKQRKGELRACSVAHVSPPRASVTSLSSRWCFHAHT